MGSSIDRLSRLGPAGAALVTAAVILVLALAMPKREIGACVRTHPLAPLLTVSLNCDSVRITRDAGDFMGYVTAPSPFRTRPVYILLTAATAHVLAPVLVPASLVARQLNKAVRGRLPLYLAAVVVNGVIAALAFLALCRLVGRPADALAAAGLAGVIASYDITLAWFWVPHQIIMNLLVPVGGVFAFVTGMRAALMETRTLVLLGLVTAVGCLTYGYCLIWPVAFALGLGLGTLHMEWEAIGWSLRKLAFYGAAVCVPLVLWFGTYAALGQEVAYEAQSVGQFSWFREAWGEGRLLDEAARQVGSLTGKLASTLGPWGFVVLLAAIGLAVRALALAKHRVLSDPVLIGVVVALVLMLAFNFLQGYHQARLLLFPLLLGQVAVLRLASLSGGPPTVTQVALVITGVQVVLGFLGPPVTLE